MIGLSPAMAAAYAAWRQQNALFDDLCVTDAHDVERVNAAGTVTAQVERVFASTPAQCLGDMAAKLHLLLETSICHLGGPGPLVYQPSGKVQSADELVTAGLCADLARLIPALYDMPHPDQRLLDAWASYIAAEREMTALGSPWTSSPAGLATYDAMDRAISSVWALPCTTTDGAIVKLWEAAARCDQSRAFQGLLINGRIDEIYDRLSEWDGTARTILQALAPLTGRAMAVTA